MSDKHIDPVVTVVPGTAEQHEVSPGTSEPPAYNSTLDRTLEDMNAKMGNMADLIGKLCQSLDERERQATGQNNSLPGTNGGKAKASTQRRSREPSVVSSSNSEASDDEVSLCASEDLLEKLVGDIAGKSGDKRGSSTNASESLLAELEAAINDEENLGPKITQQLADITLKRWGGKLSQEKLKALLSQHEVVR